jgi:hypothetical protein
LNAEELGVDANAATDEQYSEDPLDEYERRRICRPLLEFKGGSSSAVDKPQWRKKIEGIFAKVGLQLLCCSSAGFVVRGKKGKPNDWEQQLQKYVSEHYSYDGTVFYSVLLAFFRSYEKLSGHFSF